MGVSLYHLLTGGYPISGETETEVLVHLLSRQTLRPLPPDVPPAVGAVVEKALRVDPDERFATAAAMQSALEKAMVSIDAITTRHDVGAFVGERFADCETMRREAMTLARAAIKERERINHLLQQGTTHESTDESIRFRANLVPTSELDPSDLVLEGSHSGVSGVGPSMAAAAIDVPLDANAPGSSPLVSLDAPSGRLDASVTSDVFEAPSLGSRRSFLRRPVVAWSTAIVVVAVLVVGVVSVVAKQSASTTAGFAGKASLEGVPLGASASASAPSVKDEVPSETTAAPVPTPVASASSTPESSEAPNRGASPARSAPSPRTTTGTRPPLKPSTSAPTTKPVTPKGDIDDAIEFRK